MQTVEEQTQPSTVLQGPDFRNSGKGGLLGKILKQRMAIFGGYHFPRRIFAYQTLQVPQNE